MDEQEDSKIVTLKEIIAEENSLQEEAEYQSQFDWGKEDICTYDQGYLRQPLYGCNTCKEASGQQFGFCYGCSMTCHIEHDVFEMFDKRNFRCDCGTPRSGCECTFRGKTEENNNENIYTHNFDHKYCFCDGSYDSEKDIMYQCVMCLDWFHILCIENRQLENAPETEVKCDYICDVCTDKNPYLGQYYSELKLPKLLYSNPIVETEQPQEKVEDDKLEIDMKGETGCILKYLQKKYEILNPVRNTFWKKGWTNALCRCEECLALYKSHNTSYLVESEIDFDRTPEAPETNNEEQETTTTSTKLNLEDTIKNGEKVFMEAPIPHTQKIDMLLAYQSLESGLKDYLKDFAEKGKVVTKRDIEDFFEKFQDTKRRKF